jgi:hypothetical protein
MDIAGYQIVRTRYENTGQIARVAKRMSADLTQRRKEWKSVISEYRELVPNAALDIRK